MDPDPEIYCRILDEMSENMRKIISDRLSEYISESMSKQILHPYTSWLHHTKMNDHHVVRAVDLSSIFSDIPLNWRQLVLYPQQYPQQYEVLFTSSLAIFICFSDILKTSCHKTQVAGQSKYTSWVFQPKQYFPRFGSKTAKSCIASLNPTCCQQQTQRQRNG